MSFEAGAAKQRRKAEVGLDPLSRIIIITAGVLGGTLLIPEEAQTAGAMRDPAIVLAVALISIPVIEAGKLGIKPAFNTRNLLLVGIVYWLLADLIQGLYSIEASGSAILTAFLATGLFALGISIGGAVTVGRLPAPLRRLTGVDLTDRQILFLVTFCFITGVFYYVFMAGFSPSRIWTGLSDRGRFEAPWARGALGSWSSFIEQLTYFGYLLPPFTAMIIARSGRWITGKAIYCAILSLSFLIFPAQGGGRTAIGAIIGAAILVGLLTMRRPLRLRHALIALGLVFALQVGMNIILQYRGSGISSAELSDWTLYRVRVDDNFNRLAQTAHFVPELYPYSGLQFIYFSLARPIPRVLWPGKPIDQGFTVQEVVGGGATLTNSVVGEAYSGWGFPLVLAIGMFFGAAARWWEQTLDARAMAGGIMLYGLGTMALFAALRGFVNIVLFAYPILSLWAASVVFGFYRRRRASRIRPSA